MATASPWRPASTPYITASAADLHPKLHGRPDLCGWHLRLSGRQEVGEDGSGGCGQARPSIEWRMARADPWRARDACRSRRPGTVSHLRAYYDLDGGGDRIQPGRIRAHECLDHKQTQDRRETPDGQLMNRGQGGTVSRQALPWTRPPRSVLLQAPPYQRRASRLRRPLERQPRPSASRPAP
jgi:hypothetical protein